MIRVPFFALLFGVIALLFGWFTFGQVAGRQLGIEWLPSVLFGQPYGLVQTLAYDLAKFPEMRQKLLLCFAGGAALGSLIGALQKGEKINAVRESVIINKEPRSKRETVEHIPLPLNWILILVSIGVAAVAFLSRR